MRVRVEGKQAVLFGFWHIWHHGLSKEGVPKAGLSTALCSKQGFLKLMVQSRAHTKTWQSKAPGGRGLEVN